MFCDPIRIKICIFHYPGEGGHRRGTQAAVLKDLDERWCEASVVVDGVHSTAVALVQINGGDWSVENGNAAARRGQGFVFCLLFSMFLCLCV
jgi:hypothetical protein